MSNEYFPGSTNEQDTLLRSLGHKPVEWQPTPSRMEEGVGVSLHARDWLHDQARELNQIANMRQLIDREEADRTAIYEILAALSAHPTRGMTANEVDLIHACLFHHEMRMTLPARIYNATTKVAAERTAGEGKGQG